MLYSKVKDKKIFSFFVLNAVARAGLRYFYDLFAFHPARIVHYVGAATPFPTNLWGRG